MYTDSDHSDLNDVIQLIVTLGNPTRNATYHTQTPMYNFTRSDYTPRAVESRLVLSSAETSLVIYPVTQSGTAIAMLTEFIDSFADITHSYLNIE